MQNSYRQKFNHIHPKGAIFFVTFRLANSIPKSTLADLKLKFESNLNSLKCIKDIKEKNTKVFELRKNYLVAYDKILDRIITGPHYLRNNEIVEIVKKELHRHDSKLYNLICFCIMSNHVHILIDTNIDRDATKILDKSQHTDLAKIMKRIKGATARKINKTLNKSGAFWEKESYDMYIRNEKMLNNVISYILNNPVNAKLVENWEEFNVVELLLILRINSKGH